MKWLWNGRQRFAYRLGFPQPYLQRAVWALTRVSQLPFNPHSTSVHSSFQLNRHNGNAYKNKDQVQLFLPTPWRRKGSGDMAPLILNLGTMSRWVVNITTRLVPTENEAGWIQEPVWTFWLRETLLSLVGTRIPNCPSASLVTIPTTPPQPPHVNIYVLYREVRSWDVMCLAAEQREFLYSQSVRCSCSVSWKLTVTAWYTRRPIFGENSAGSCCLLLM